MAALGALAAPAAAQASIHQRVVVAQAPAQATPQVLDGRVQAIVQIGSTVVVGGKFSQVKLPGGQTLARSDLFAFDASTGAISTTFAPQIDGGSVFTLERGADGASVIVGGAFTQVDGHSRTGLVRLELADGSLDPAFAPGVDGRVSSSALSGGRLFLAGAFSHVGGVVRTGLAEVDAQTGALVPGFDFTLGSADPAAVQAGHVAVSPGGRRLVVTGRFGTVDGKPRMQIAMIDLGTSPATLVNWSTAVLGPASLPAGSATPHCDDLSDEGNIRDVDFSPNGRYFVVGTTGGPALDCDSVLRFETGATGLRRLPTWVDHTGGDSITQIAVTGTAVYAGGHQRWMENTGQNASGSGGIRRWGIAALDPVNGMPFSWNPGRNPRGTGVYAFLATSAGLWVGSDTDYIDARYHPRLAFFPTSGGTAVRPATVPRSGTAIGTVGPAGVAIASPATHIRRAVRCARAWRSATGAFVVSGTLYGFTRGGRLLTAPLHGRGLGPTHVHPLTGLTNVGNVAGAFYDPSSGLLYYAIQGDSNLYARYFEPQDDLLAAPQVVAGRLPEQVTALTARRSRLLYVSSAGVLTSIAWHGGTVGTARRVIASGWAGTRGIFVTPR